jgi:hypothetical protein
MSKDKETDKEREERERVEYGVLGNIQPDEPAPHPIRGKSDPFHDEDVPESEANEPMEGGSKHDRSQHPGSREMTEGTTGNAGTEVGGTRNFRTGTGAVGSDIGGRPE